MMEKILAATPDSGARNMVFWAGGYTVRDDIDEWIESQTRMPNGGVQFMDVFGQQIMDDMGVTHGTPQYYRAVNRMSKGMSPRNQVQGSIY